MTSKERVMTALNFQRPDRIPRFDNFWSEFKDECIKELGLSKDVDLTDYFGIDIAIAVADETPFPTKREVISEDKNYRIERDSWGRVIRTARSAYFYEELDVSIKNIKSKKIQSIKGAISICFNPVSNRTLFLNLTGIPPLSHNF